MEVGKIFQVDRFPTTPAKIWLAGQSPIWPPASVHLQGVLIHRRTRLIKVEKYTRAIICSLWTVTHMIVATLLTFYKLNRDKIVNLNRQQRTSASRTKRTHQKIVYSLW